MGLVGSWLAVGCVRVVVWVVGSWEEVSCALVGVSWSDHVEDNGVPSTRVLMEGCTCLFGCCSAGGVVELCIAWVQ